MGSNNPASIDHQYEAGQEVVPGYTLVRRLGSGMAGDVWVAQAAGGIQVAIKIVRALSMVGGRKELKALKTIRNVVHPNLCPLFGFWTKDVNGRILADGETEELTVDSVFHQEESGATPALSDTMAVSPTATPVDVDADEAGLESGVDGGQEKARAEQLFVVMGLGDCTLYDRVQEVRRQAGIAANADGVVGGLDAAESIRYLRASASAIDLLNREHHIYHCDIKPQNILLVGGEAQVCDFGLANRIEGDMRQTQRAFATPAYAAPEVLHGQTYSRSVDQYSLATTYYELRTGLLPFDITTPHAMVIAKCSGKLDLSKVSSAERKVLHKALHIDPVKRFNSCSDFVRALAVATGVEQGGGITLPRLAAALALLVAVSAATLYGLKVFHPTSYRALIDLVSTGRSATELFAATTKKFQPFEQPNSEQYASEYAVARGTLTDVIEESKEVHAIADDHLQPEIEQITVAATSVLLRKLADRLELFAAGESLSGAERKNAESDLRLLESTYRGTGETLFDQGSSAAARTAAQVELSRLRIALPTAFDGSASDAQVANDAAANLRSLFDALPSGDQPIAAIAIALTTSLPNDPRTATELPIDDLVRVKSSLAEADPDEILPWYRNRWNRLEETFIPRLQAAYGGSSTLPTTRQVIEQYWPNSALDAGLIACKEAMRQRRWSDAENLLAELKRDFAEPATNDERITLASMLVEAVSSPMLAAQSFARVTARLQSSGPPARDFCSDLLPSWMAELTDRVIGGTASVSLEQALEIQRNSQTLAELAGLDPPVDFSALVMAKSIALSPLHEHPQVRALVLSSPASAATNAWLSTALRVEADAFGNRDWPALTSRERQDAASVIEAIVDLSRFERPVAATEYATFLSGLLAWTSGKPTAAIDFWDVLRQPQNELQAAGPILGSARCEFVAQAYLAQATSTSGVADDEVLNLRFVDRPNAAELVDGAAWWIGQHKQPASPGLQAELATQQLLVEVSNRIRSADGDGGPAVALAELAIADSLRENLHAAAAMSGKVPARHGQLARASLEVSLAFCDIHSTLHAQRGLTDQLHQQQSLMLAAAVVAQALELDAVRHTPAVSTLIERVIEPTMTILDPLLQRDPADPTRWVAADYLDQDELRWFLDSYLSLSENETARTYHRGNLGSWMSQLEKSAAYCAAHAVEPERQAERWIEAATFYREDRVLQRQEWQTDEIRLFMTYVQRAVQALGADNAKTLSLKAYAKFYQSELATNMQARNEQLRESWNYLRAAIEQFDAATDPAGLYNALWRKSDALVKLAYTESNISSKRELLLEASDAADQAIALLGDRNWNVGPRVKTNAAYMSRGNCLEDLALYCLIRADQQAEQHATFEQSIASFRQAVALTIATDPLKQRVYLGRCIYRYWENGGPRDLLEQAQVALGDEPKTGDVLDVVRWYAWMSKVEHQLIHLDRAVELAEAGYQRAMRESRPDLFDEVNAMLINYAELLLTRNQPDKSLDLLSQLKSPDLNLYWDSVLLRADIWKGTDQIQALAELLNSAEFAQRCDSDLALDTNRVLPVLATMARHIEKSALATTSGMKPALESEQAIELIDGILARCRAHSIDESAAEFAQTYFAAIGCYRLAMTESSSAERITAALAVLDRADGVIVENSRMLIEIRELLLDLIVEPSKYGTEALDRYRDLFTALTEQAAGQLQSELEKLGKSRPNLASRATYARDLVTKFRPGN